MAVASFFLPVVGVSASNRAVLRVSNGQKWPGSGFCTGTDEHAAWARIGGIWHGMGSLRKNSVYRESRFEEAIGLFLYYAYTVDAATPLYPSQRILYLRTGPLFV